MVYSTTRVNMGAQDIQGYTRYTVLLGWKRLCFFSRAYRVYSTTRVNMGAQDIQGYTRYTVLLG